VRRRTHAGEAEPEQLEEVLRAALRDPLLRVAYKVPGAGAFLEALRRVASGGSALDPEVVARLLAAPRHDDPLAALTAREREALTLMAEDRTNVGIARRLWLTDRTVETHIGSIMAKLGLAASDEDHRRVLAVLAYLRASV
jgi:DNA-binding NarL/FixJ family response regulator